MDVYSTNGEEIGDIDEVLVNASGQPVAVSVEVGGFLGIGDREVIVQLNQLRLDGQRFVVSLTREQIEALPRWDD
jgi:sporulation protein YlmC with PRC-barrel domain